MSYMKRYAMDVSIDMGLGGEITEEVLIEAQRRMDKAAQKPPQQGVQWIDLSGLIEGEWYQWDAYKGYMVRTFPVGAYLIQGPEDEE